MAKAKRPFDEGSKQRLKAARKKYKMSAAWRKNISEGRKRMLAARKAGVDLAGVEMAKAIEPEVARSVLGDWNISEVPVPKEAPRGSLGFQDAEFAAFVAACWKAWRS